MTAGGLCGRFDDDPRRGGSLLDIRQLLAASGIVLHLEAGDGIVQTTVLPAAGLFPAGKPALKSFDRLERPRPLDLFSLLRLTPTGYPVALGRLEDSRQRLHLASHLG